MAVGKPLGDLAADFNYLYRITLDLSGWDKTAIQAVAPIGGAIIVYGSNDPGTPTSPNQVGDPSRAQNFSPILVTNLATGATSSSISAAGNYKYPVDMQFIRLQGAPAAAGTNVYKLFLFNSKV